MNQETRREVFIHPNALVETDMIGKGTRIWAFAHVMCDVTLGSDCNIGDHSYIESGVVIGNRVTIKNGVSVWKGVTLADDVFVGPNAVFTNDLRPKSRNANFDLQPTEIQKGVSIGANATILCGITLGERSLIGAGAVVTQSVPPGKVVYGNPARIRGDVV